MENRRIASPYCGLIYKEWLKLRFICWLPFVLAFAVLAYSYFEMLGVQTAHGGVALWRMVVFKDEMPFKPIKYIPLVSGILIGAAQWLPETLNKKIRVFLHLPVNQYVALGLSLGVGLLFMIAISLLLIFGEGYLSTKFLPHEVSIYIMQTIVPWCIAGVIGYVVIAMTLIETKFVARLLYACVGAVFLKALFASDVYGTYINSSLYFVLVVLALLVAMFSLLDRVKRSRA
ncbi:hypothetical protein [Taylorella equigenitalis]|uniref:ABC transporter permease n=2 Tax=Taylorella equigenitalis TaxID=29575 RepID=A0ABN4AWW6_9BURK|nr:hypothetical protein [Taylorella equigenitalis]AFN35270.1 hypothetical protein KUI_0169 [Taylorella equigenitalis ATCC 35865]ASY31216.1 hypothetical protein B9Z30_00720 [Taylorella equigenitalis]ASY38512.1 hypothetical protein CA605_00685 [Taylorella equigenitalis]ASY40056.1 hypothetical protein CA604_00840 [Taylorella equigenitalis]ASY41664.1 hypothetical protein CA943_00685 [Taylorella equigenitalis]